MIAVTVDHRLYDTAAYPIAAADVRAAVEDTLDTNRSVWREPETSEARPRCGYSSTATTHQPSLPLVVMRPCNSAPVGARDALARSLAAVAGVRVFYAGGGSQSMRAVSLLAGVGGVDGELMPLAVGVRLGVPAPHAPS